MNAAISASGYGEIVTQERQQSGATEITFASGRSLLVSNFLGTYVDPGDEIKFALPCTGETLSSPELLIKRVTGPCVYQTSVRYAARPKTDKIHHPYVHVEIAGGTLGFTALHLPCAALRDYFYSPHRSHNPDNQSLYEVLKTRPGASPGDLRLAYKLRELELCATSAPRAQRSALERAFNMLAIPELRSSHDALLIDPALPVVFPFSGFGLILVLGVPMKDRFLARRIISFLSERKKRRFKLPLRKLTYYQDRALYRDARAKLEMTFDPILLPIGFKSDWNGWKHLIGATVDVEAEFAKTGKYYRRGGQWNLATWEIALPSRIQLRLPDNLQESVNVAQRTHHRFGQYSDWVSVIRERVEHLPVEKRELERLAAREGVPADFDLAQVNWKADYDPYYYRQLCQRASWVYLYRDEYIFLTERAVVVETPQAGHATYIFSRPNDMDLFLRAYVRASKQTIRANHANCAENLGFLARIVHGSHHQSWLNDLRKWLGEPVEFIHSVT
jgi:hypothetical protein